MPTQILNGMSVSYGPTKRECAVSGLKTAGGEKELRVTILATDLTLSTTGFNGGVAIASGIRSSDATLPANAAITKAVLKVKEAFTSAGAATLTIGTTDMAGVVSDADGIDATIALADIDAVGEVVVCNGALIGVTGDAAENAITVAAGTAVYTAGVAELVVSYV